MPRATLTHADQLFYGSAQKAQAYNAKRGLPMSPIAQFDLGAPAALSATAIINASAVAGAGAVTLNGALVSGGVATLGGNCGRSLSMVSSNAGDTTQTITVRGKDYLGDSLTETKTLNGTTTVQFNKAFKTVSSVTASAALTGNLSVGTNDKLGLPFRVDGRFDLLSAYMDATDEVATVTLAAADTTNPATAATGDVRGTMIPATATNGTRRYRVWLKPGDGTQSAYGVAQFAG